MGFLVNSYPDRTVPRSTRTREVHFVPVMVKSTCNLSLGYQLTFQQFLMKTHTQTYSLLGGYQEFFSIKTNNFIQNYE